jgi:hypothetical protein
MNQKEKGTRFMPHSHRKRTTTMTFRMATPEETKARYGKPLILFGVKPPASWGARSPSTPAKTLETKASNSALDLPRDPVEGMERQVNQRFGPPKDPSTAPAPYVFTKTDQEMAEALGFAWPPARLKAASSPSGWMMPMPEH